MEKKNKIRVIQDYEKISKEIQEQIKLAYPDGFSHCLIEFTNPKGEYVSALPFETEDKIYMVRMSVSKAEQIIEDDEDYDEDGTLKENVKEMFEEKYSDTDSSSDDDEDDSYDDADADEGDSYDDSDDDSDEDID